MCRVQTNAIMIPGINYSFPRLSLDDLPIDSVPNAIKLESYMYF
jgi:hypothetical protein